MKSKVLGIALSALTVCAVIYYPTISAKHLDGNTPTDLPVNDKPVVDAVFVLDTTGSMAGLIQTAKDKIWSIATTMASAQPTPEIRIGLVGYRDRGDAYVTKVVELSEDLDSVYAALMDFQADGGGDTPESVNQALYEAVHGMAWSQHSQAYRVIFLVGDAPPHMDYQNDVKYPQILQAAQQKGLVVNTIQCGNTPTTIEPWQQIAKLGDGKYFQVEQAGGAVAYSSPFDAKLAELSARLDETRLYYGNEEDKERMRRKMAATDKLHSSASPEALARRGIFNASVAGKANLSGGHELVDAVTRGAVDLDDIEAEALPESLQLMAPEEQKAVVADLAEKRSELAGRIRELAGARDAFIQKKVDEVAGAKDSLDQKIYDAVSRQAETAGLVYEGGPAY